MPIKRMTNWLKSHFAFLYWLLRAFLIFYFIAAAVIIVLSLVTYVFSS
jgi:hypothetical protein